MAEPTKTRNEAEIKWGRIVARAWTDAAYKQRLLADASAVLRAEGMEVPPGVQVKVVEDSNTLVHFTLPPKPADQELSEEELDNVAGGFSCACAPCISSCIRATQECRQ
jgi:hypothetical protein